MYVARNRPGMASPEVICCTRYSKARCQSLPTLPGVPAQHPAASRISAQNYTLVHFRKRVVTTRAPDGSRREMEIWEEEGVSAEFGVEANASRRSRASHLDERRG